MLMGIATFLVAFVPGYASIGIWGAIILTILRFFQGIGVGGEWGGSVLLSMEWARHNGHRGLVASWPQFGVPAGLFIANLAVLAFSQMSGDAFLSWGWRVPFLLSIILVGIGLWIRLGITETPTFQRLVREQKIERAPFIEVFKKQPAEIFLTAFARMGQQAPFYIFTSFIFAYGTGTLHASRDMLLIGVLVASCISFVTVPLAGHVSDRVGRKKTYILGAIATALYAFIYFGLLDTMSTVWIFVAVAFSLVVHDFQYGPQAALIAECFTPRLRYSGASMGYQLASIIAGGPAPLIATYLFGTYHSSMVIALYMLGCCVVTVIATACLRDYTGKEIAEEYDADHAGAVARPLS